MPPKVDRWLAQCRVVRSVDELPSSARPLVAKLNNRTAVLRYLAGSAGQPDVILVTETDAPQGVGDLEALGLSKREAEVLRLVGAGATNAAVGRELHISAGTVKKHLDHIYAKLAVTGRVQAAAVLHEMAAHHQSPRTNN
jgi:DNA-binding CsgD family transcriptional regulator